MTGAGQCPARYGSDRCILVAGHEGHHYAGDWLAQETPAEQDAGAGGVNDTDLLLRAAELADAGVTVPSAEVADVLRHEAAARPCDGCGCTESRCYAAHYRDGKIKCCPECDHRKRIRDLAATYLGEST